MTTRSAERDARWVHHEWCDANGCRCGECPCLGQPWCSPLRPIPPAVTSVEPGCTCGGMAACPQCQGHDAATRPVSPEGTES